MMNVRTWTPETYSAENARNNRVDAVIYPHHVSIDCQITGCAKRETALRRFWQALESAKMTGGLCMADVNAMLSDVNTYNDGFYTIGVEYSDDTGFYIWFSYKTENAEKPAENSASDYTALTDTIRAELNARHDRSAWDKAVTLYDLDLLDDVQEGENNMERLPLDGAELERWALNGANNWHQYSWGGCSLCYDADIAARVCTPSELKRTDGGMNNPNSRETWLDVQARALHQACNRIRTICRTNGLYCKGVQ